MHMGRILKSFKLPEDVLKMLEDLAKAPQYQGNKTQVLVDLIVKAATARAGKPK